uniref:WecB/TagA/CpsF family glycosyltransferase n=1 Tax=Vibrio cholerae TaxID=666 RepID=UPI001C103202
AGHVSRDPLWMQKAGLKRIYRVLQEPGRMWKRYLINNSRYAWLLINKKIKPKN